MTLLITGGTGLVGRHLVQHLLDESPYANQPEKIRLLVRNKERNPHQQRFLQKCFEIGVDIFLGNLRNDDDVLAFTDVSDPQNSILIHSGAIFNFWQPYELLYDVNVCGTMRILHGFLQNRIKKMIYLSSVAVYGRMTGNNGRGVTETSEIDLTLNKNYELTKALGEACVQEFQNNHPEKLITILRPSGIIGGSGSTLDVLARMFVGRFAPLPRGGKDRISLVDVKDVVSAIVYFSDFTRGNGEEFNLVSFTPTLREVVQELSQALQKKNLNIIAIPLFIFKPLYYLARIIRKIKKPQEHSFLLPVLFDKLGQDVWIDSEKLRLYGFQSNGTNLSESMARFGSFLAKNPWYAEQKFGFAL
ncbi:MAG: NAD(P)-dependent oxidoreductase [Candidatus Heimdallarchaeota archaeon]|nr:MAG: NAD(P)-dependent oxidoreductase [Candidatus Heimdallarchaeota archaeon]